MHKRLVILMLLLIAVVSVVPAMAQDAEPTPIVAEAGDGAIQLRFWNGLTGSDGVTMVEMVQKFTE